MYIDKSKIIVVIPIYHYDFSETERQAISNNVQVLSSYTIAIIKPRSLGLDVNELSEELNFVTPPLVYSFDDRFFKSIAGYNRLMLSKEFYQTFGPYTYMLICQPDAYIFSDTLEKWAAKKYGYIGAPWTVAESVNFMDTVLSGKLKILKLNRTLNRFLFNKKDYAIGNGGLSLRHIKKSLTVLKSFGFLANKWNENEDLFWSIIAPLIFPLFKVPNLEDGIGFSFEKDPAYFFKLNNDQLPFGRHAWEKYDRDFWKKYIPVKSME